MGKRGRKLNLLRKKKQVRRRSNLNVTQKTRVPVAKGQRLRNTNPLNSVRLRNREYVREIQGDGSSLKIQTITINPGNSEAFGWLSTIAPAFESYVLNALTYTYVPSCSSASAGYVALVPDYDVSDRVDGTLLTKQRLLSMQDAIRSSIWDSCSMIATPKNLRKQKTYYVETDASSDDPRTSHVGTLYTLTDGGDGVGGELWVEYDVTLFTPQAASGFIHHDEYSGTLSETDNVEKLYPFITGDGQLMTLIGTDDGVSLHKDGDKIIFTEPNKTYKIDMEGKSNSGTMTEQSPAGWFSNATGYLAGTIYFIRSLISDDDDISHPWCYVTTPAGTSADDPVVVQVTGFAASESHLDSCYLSILEVLSELIW